MPSVKSVVKILLFLGASVVFAASASHAATPQKPNVVLFLVDDEGGFITGSTLSVNGGQHMY